MNPFAERSDSSENIYRNSRRGGNSSSNNNNSFYRSSFASSPVTALSPTAIGGGQLPLLTTTGGSGLGSATQLFTPCSQRTSQTFRSLQQTSVKVRVNDPYARTIPLEEPLSSGCQSLDTSDESVRSPVVRTMTPGSPTTVVTSQMTRVYVNGRPVPAFASGELAVAVPAHAVIC